MDNDDNYVAILLEDMNDKIDVVVEAVGQLHNGFKTLATKKELSRVEAKVDTLHAALTDTNVELATVKSDVKDIKADMANTNQALTGLTARVTTLERT